MSTPAAHKAPSRARIIEAAMKVFAGDGFQTARVEDLLMEASIARRTFYKYFRNKTEVLAALYQYVSAELIGRIAEAGLASDDPLAGLRAALDTYLQFHVSNHAIARVLLVEALRTGSPLSPLRKELRAGLIAAIDAAYFNATERRIDTLVFAGLLSALEGLSLDLLEDGAPSDSEVERTRAAILGMLEACVRAPDALPSA